MRVYLARVSVSARGGKVPPALSLVIAVTPDQTVEGPTDELMRGFLAILRLAVPFDNRLVAADDVS